MRERTARTAGRGGGIELGAWAVILRLLTLPFRLAGFLFSVVFVVGMIEFFGLMMYSLWQHEAALQGLMASGPTPGSVLAFLLASPDRLVVAGLLAIVGMWMVLNGGSGSGRVHVDGDIDGGFGGDGGGGGGGFGGDGGGGGGGGE